MARHPRENRGPSQRQLRVGELIRRKLSEILMRGEVHDEELNSLMITVNEVTVSADLKIATAWVLPLGGDRKEEAIAALKRCKGQLRHLTGKDMTLRHSPDLRFRIDETFDRMDATRALFADETVARDVAATDDGEGDADGDGGE
ncbi:30S ribosome-binding factor RbfA [Jannaschia donghaensis]|uniref:Ribosome-binding factor A n=1 Tax=Jannaschia donghaensis TaxID=420998 RepID=A0A0M6YF25_9RHOB|nr:30S ribosome-binding factor RbfA [Jannaschia donghaensis]CTQ48359.1 Ribosome-binding factor A [Jannaschia donghaensis]